MNQYRFGRGRTRPLRPLWRRLVDYALTIILLFLLIVFVARLNTSQRVSPQGAAIVNDGDSLTIGTLRVRLRGIDAPEFNQTCLNEGKNYPCGRKARDALRALIGGSAVSCSGTEQDRYGRLLSECKAGGIDLNARLVQDGWALAYGGYDSEEDEARQNRRGLWAGEFERPRDWRVRHGEAAEPTHDFLAMLGDRLRKWFSELLSRD